VPLQRIRGFLLDLDGTLYQGRRLIPGTKRALWLLRKKGLGVAFVTNTTSRSRRALSAKLRAMGIPCTPDEIVNAPSVAAGLLRRRGIRRCLLLAGEGCAEDFLAQGVHVVGPDAEPHQSRRIRAVVVGDLGEQFTFRALNTAFLRILEGAILISMSPNRYWKAPGGLRLDAGPFVAALEYATQVKAELAAKPSPAMFHLGCDILGAGPSEVLMVGDDAETDASGARRAGLWAALVQTGKYRSGDESRVDPPPHLVVPKLLHLVRLLEP
jgi:HAD superfamily hydrolase (TIGR01458 family)